MQIQAVNCVNGKAMEVTLAPYFPLFQVWRNFFFSFIHHWKYTLRLYKLIVFP